MMSNHYDITIIGGGLVGLSLAYALRSTSLKVALVNAKVPTEQDVFADKRALGLTYGSYKIYNLMNLWDDSLDALAEPIVQTHITQRGGFGQLTVDAKRLNVPALGYVLPFGQYTRILRTKAQACTHLTWYEPAMLQSYEDHGDVLKVELNQAETNISFSTSLLVGADGRRSMVRQLAGIDIDTFDYRQMAIVSTIKLARPHDGHAHERFLPTGPLAMLPLPDQYCGIVWCVPKDQVAEYQALNDEAFLAAAQKAFGYRLGRFQSVGERFYFPLTFQKAKRLIRPRVTLVGNAAHQIHPMAAQGFNLGLRDVWALAQWILLQHSKSQDPADHCVLKQWVQARIKDQQKIQTLNDRTVRLFSNRLPLLKQVRSMGLMLNEFYPRAKKSLACQLMR